MSDLFRDMSFGGIVRAQRIKLGLTLREAAKKVGMDVGNLSKLERSMLDPPSSKEAVKSFCKKLGIADDLLMTVAFNFHLSKFRRKW